MLMRDPVWPNPVQNTEPRAIAARFLAGQAERTEQAERRESPRAAPSAVLGPRELAHADSVLARAFVWRDDGFCLARATLGAQLVQERFGRAHPARADELAAGVAVAAGPFSDRVPGWSTHAAVVVRLRGGPAMVIDHTLFDRPVPLSSWAAKLGVRPEAVQVSSPFHKREWEATMRRNGEVTRLRGVTGEPWPVPAVQEWGAQIAAARRVATRAADAP